MVKCTVDETFVLDELELEMKINSEAKTINIEIN